MAVYEARSAARRPIMRPLRERLVDGLLFVTVFAGSIVFVEPSPYEAAFGLLLIVALAAGIRFDPLLIPLASLLLLWNLSGAFSLTLALHDGDSIRFIVTSFYLAASAILFACLLGDDTVRRISIIRRAYIATAILTALAGMAMYFQLVPALDPTADRLRGLFKDPNVFAPFLILPLLYLIDAIIRHGFSLPRMAGALVLLIALFLSYSRGAWAHFIVSGMVLVGLMFLTAPTARFRGRVLGLSIVAAIGAAALVAALLSFESIGTMFTERASLLQEYDTGPAGRFGRQALALEALFGAPLGLGPMQFGKIFGLDPHNVYLNAFLSYGWVGGVSYIVLVAVTILVGLRAALLRTPWQPFLLPALATLIGVVGEGFVIDTDHWRHFYLLLGIVWGLSAASNRAVRAAPMHGAVTRPAPA